MKMYYMPPPFGRSNKYDTDMDIPSIVAKVLDKIERKKQKEEEKKKGKKGPDAGVSFFQLFVFFTAITPFVGPASVWATSYMMRQAFENLQAIVPH